MSEVRNCADLKQAYQRGVQNFESLVAREHALATAAAQNPDRMEDLQHVMRAREQAGVILGVASSALDACPTPERVAIQRYR